jgi:hypothetical protein
MTKAALAERQAAADLRPSTLFVQEALPQRAIERGGRQLSLLNNYLTSCGKHPSCTKLDRTRNFFIGAHQ